MIVKAIMDMVMALLQNVLSFISIPALPQPLTSSIDGIIDLMFSNLGIVGLFVRWQTILVSVPLVLVVVNIEKIYSLIMWILKKIPMLGMK